METIDSNALTQLMLRLGLVNETQIMEGWEAVGYKTPEPEPLLRALERKGFVTPYQSQKLLKGEPGGYFYGGYRVLYKIASGSFGRVYRAEDRHTGRVVAIKVLRKRWSEDEHTIALFEREGRVGTSLRHPNIVEVLDVAQDPITTQYYIVMEFVEGGNLRQILGVRRKLEVREALRLLDDAASGMAHAYSRGVTHRDMKLTNVLISSQGLAKLVDFGLAGIFTRKGLELEGGEKVDRTVDYAGLEKATGVKPGDVRSDIYFLGCVAYEMLTGRSPLLMTRDARQRMAKQRFDSVPPMRPEEVDGPHSLFLLIERMMSLDPLQRYQTPSQLLDAIREVRKEIEEGITPTAKPVAKSLFIVEREPRLQDPLRDHFKERGFRVFLAADPARALDRYRTHPFDALLMDAGTTGDEGRYSFEQIVRQSTIQTLPCAGILILSEEQASWAGEIQETPTTAVLVRPVTLKQVSRKLEELISRAETPKPPDAKPSDAETPLEE
jgi:serine/threonine protein kinase